MDKQVIISIGREYGSGGHIVADEIAKKFNLPVYDKNIIDDVAKKMNIDASNLEKFVEAPRNKFFTRTVAGYTNSPEQIVADMEFNFLREKAESGESFIVVGRCANSVLKDYEGLVSVFITSDMDDKIERIMKLHNVSRDRAELMILKNNKARKNYHNSYCKEKWGDSRYYYIFNIITR